MGEIRGKEGGIGGKKRERRKSGRERDEQCHIFMVTEGDYLVDNHSSSPAQEGKRSKEMFMGFSTFHSRLHSVSR